MTEKIREALHAGRQDPGAVREMLTALITEDRRRFIGASAGLALSEEDPSVLEPLIALLAASGGVAELLCDPHTASKNACVALARLIAQVEPYFDTRLVRLL